MRDSKHYRKPWIFPTLATIALLPLFAHKSEFPMVFNKYSVGYTIILILLLINLALFWRASLRGVSYRQMLRGFTDRRLVPIIVLIISVAFLVDFITGPPGKPSDWLILTLLAALVIQGEGLRKETRAFPGYLALCSVSLVFSIIMLELVFGFFLFEGRTPKSQNEFLQLMSSQWPQPISVTKPAETLRILGLSDSFGTAGGLTANYHYVLENLLQRQVSASIQMVNVSVPAYEPAHQLALLRFALLYSPDVVLHGFVVGNDFSLRDNEMLTFRGIYTYRERSDSPLRPRHFLIRDWAENAITYLKANRKKMYEKRAGVVKELGSMSKSRFLELQYSRMNDWGKRTNKNVNRMKSILPILDKIRSTVERSGARYVMVIHPDQTQVDEGLERDIIRRFDVDGTEYDFELPQKILYAYCSERGIVCLDLLPLFRVKAKNSDLYLLRDTHYNEEGNRLAARAISEFLQAESTLPETPRNGVRGLYPGR